MKVAKGFEEWATGGGFGAWGLKFGDKGYIMITEAEVGDLPESMDKPVDVGVYDHDSGENWVTFIGVPTLRHFLNLWNQDEVLRGQLQSLALLLTEQADEARQQELKAAIAESLQAEIVEA